MLLQKLLSCPQIHIRKYMQALGQLLQVLQLTFHALGLLLSLHFSIYLHDWSFQLSTLQLTIGTAGLPTYVLWHL